MNTTWAVVKIRLEEKRKKIAIIFNSLFAAHIYDSVVNDGRTAVRQAARTLLEFRGQGVYKRLSETMNVFVWRQYPNVQREIFASTACPSSAREITQMTIIRTSAVNRSLLALNSLKVNFSDLIEPCTKEYLCDTIFSSPVAQKLFPANSIVLDWIPMEASRSNIDHFQHELGQDFYFAVDKCGEDGIHRSVSFGALTPRVGCIDWTVTISIRVIEAYTKLKLLINYSMRSMLLKASFLSLSPKTKVCQIEGENCSKKVCLMWNLTKHGPLSSFLKMCFSLKNFKQ